MASTLLTSAQDIFRKDDSFAGFKDIVAEFPPGSRLISARPLGISTWTNTTRLSVEHPDGKEKVYFLKCAQSEDGRVLVQGEFNSMSEIYATAPGFVPKPYTWGTCYLDDTEAYFFISEFIDFSNKCLANRKVWVPCYDLLRKNSPKRSMGEKLDGFLFQAVGACSESRCEDEWPWGYFEILARRCVEAVVPRLIGVLGRDGRKVKPCLIHGDLWEGNTGTSLETGDIYVFDSAAFYAHNEMETGNWRCHYNNLRDPLYTQTYLSLIPPSDPRDIWDDRNCLYSVYYTVIYSVNHRCQGTAVRQTAYDDLYDLINQYAPFGEGAGPPPLALNERVELPRERDHTRV
ncbi:hypothetical protein F9C07_1507406 [Aspergillus flavus]|uniref:protein-ribulosamine 3-kinase n=1 Tax=Aspergillus flavus (strain ATCC 200026 / FGSC A1120 / IAM 13836 / NRRL 3357 / JCM 12722 / SRRC 167) TaxID=332952 RepID=A0A7U2MTQ1_ASPFN|nr:hypothetical protein F9C07_1507406 [Aspergillus flavus]